MNSYSNTVSNPFLEGYWLDLRVTVPVWLPQNSEGYQRASDIPQVTDFFFFLPVWDAPADSKASYRDPQ